MFQNISSLRPGGDLPPDPYPRPHHPRSRSASRSRHDESTRLGQERGLLRGGPVYRHPSPSRARHPSPSRARHPSPSRARHPSPSRARQPSPSRARQPSPSPSRHPSRPHRQHSREHHAHSRSRPAMPDYRHNLKPGNSPRAHHHQPEHNHSRRDDSVSSSSSSGSLFDRVGARSGYASSRTSLEDEAEAPKRGRRLPEVRTIRERRLDQHTVGATTPALPEDGNSVWSRVAAAASTLTVSVSKAWAANVTTSSGEDTPPGDESKLFRAMKAYHLDKARDPSDLPPWLFSEQERRPVGQLRLASRHDNADGSLQPSPLSPSKSRGLRDIYDAAATVTSPTSPRNFADVPTSKAASHLKALRDAKRNALNPTATSPREEKLVERDEVQHRRRAHRRMGMPVGPGMKHGRF